MTALDKGKKMTLLVQGVQSGFGRVADSIGLDYSLMKSNIALVKKIPDACAIASIGTVGDVRGGIAVSFDSDGFGACVSSMSGGMLAGSINDDMSISCVGEMVNMIGGGVAIYGSGQGINLDVTPPQIFTGDRISQTYPTLVNWVSVPYLVRGTGKVYLNVFVSDE